MVQLRASMGYVDLQLPEIPGLLEAAGGVALAHGQLELMLRMTIKTLANVSVLEALQATEKKKAWQLREDILKLFRSKTTDAQLRVRLEAMMNRCEKLSAERNRLLHNAWAISPDGSVVTKGETHAWGPAATVESLNECAAAIGKVVEELNVERLRGFIRAVVKDGAA